jgi:hypothetical protein
MSESINVGSDRALAASRVSAPAIALMIVAGLSLALHLLSIVLNLIGVGAAGVSEWAPKGNLPPEAERIQAMLGGGIGVVIGLFFIALHALVLVGAMRMRALSSYGLAMAGSIAAMVACSPGCCCCLPLGLPFGIWALVVLMDQNVKASFA